MQQFDGQFGAKPPLSPGPPSYGQQQPLQQPQQQQQQQPMMSNFQNAPPMPMQASVGVGQPQYPPQQFGNPALGANNIVVVNQQSGGGGGWCTDGQHVYSLHYGMCGIVSAIVFFPIGLLCLFADMKRVCSRCGFTTGV